MPEQCFNGFYCPGARDDVVNVVPGSRPIILAAGDATETVNEQLVTEVTTSAVSTNLTLEADIDTLNTTELRMQLAHVYQVPWQYIQLDLGAGSVTVAITIEIPNDVAASATGTALDASSILARVTSINETALVASTGFNLTISAPPLMANKTVVTISQVAKIRRVTCLPGFFCAAGVVTPCPRNYYNPLADQSNATACLRCPLNSQTDTEASVRLGQCLCRNGFVQVARSDGGFECLCPPGHTREENSDREQYCARCTYGYYKAETSNGICTACTFRPLSMPPSTMEDGATSVDQCVCAIGYYMTPNATLPTSQWFGGGANGASGVCRECDTEKTRCSEAATSLVTMPVRPGFWRVNEYSARLRACPQEAASLVCTGTIVNASAGSGQLPAVASQAVSQCREGHDATKPFCASCTREDAEGNRWTMGKDGTCELCRGDLFATIFLPSAFVAVLVIAIVYLACSGAKGRDRLKRLAHASQDVLETVADGQRNTSKADSVSDGSVLTVLGRTAQAKTKAQVKAATVDRVTSFAAAKAQDKAEEANAHVDNRIQLLAGVSKTGRVLLKMKRFIGKSYVKIRILISLAQVLNGIGTVFEIPYPAFYTNMCDWFAVIQLDFFEFVPLDCIVPITFHTTLLVRTIWPIATCVTLWIAGRALQRTRHFAWAASTCQSAIFFIAFLVYPGCSAKVFATYQCQELDGRIQPDDWTAGDVYGLLYPGDSQQEGQQRVEDEWFRKTHWLRADLSINCNHPYHIVMQIYATFMFAVYPVGIPLFFAYTFFYSYRDELLELRRREIRAAAHTHLRETAQAGAQARANKAKMLHMAREQRQAKQEMRRLKRQQMTAVKKGDRSQEELHELETSVSKTQGKLRKLDSNMRGLSGKGVIRAASLPPEADESTTITSATPPPSPPEPPSPAEIASGSPAAIDPPTEVLLESGMHTRLDVAFSPLPATSHGAGPSEVIHARPPQHVTFKPASASGEAPAIVQPKPATEKGKLSGRMKRVNDLTKSTHILHTDATTISGVQKLAKDGRLPEYVKKLVEGYDLRVYWFELFECGRKILLVGMPVFFEMGSITQLTYGLMVCFISFGMYMVLSPYAKDSDDRLAQLCQMQIFFSLVSSLLLRWDEVNSSAGGERTQNLDVMLCSFTFLPLGFAFLVHAFEEGLYTYFKELLTPIIAYLYEHALMPLKPYYEPALARLRVRVARHGVLPFFAEPDDDLLTSEVNMAAPVEPTYEIAHEATVVETIAATPLARESPRFEGVVCSSA